METVFFRNAEIETPDVATGAIKLSFASELPVLRSDSSGQYWEVLSHAPGDANFGFINRKGVALQDHNEKLDIGDVVNNSVKVDADKKTRGEIKLYDENWQTRVKTDWSKIPVSVGYTRLSIVSESVGEDKIPVRRFAWSPYEVSLLTVRAADSTVGINRAAEIDSTVNVETKVSEPTKIIMSEKIEITEAQRKEFGDAALTTDRARRKAIHDAAEKIAQKTPTMAEAIRKIATDCDLAGETVGDFSGKALEAFGARKLDHTEAHIGMSQAEVEDYSIVRAVQSCMNSKSGKIEKDCPEFDYNQEAEKRYGKRSSSFWIPTDVTVGKKGDPEKGRRDMQVNIFGQGGAFVPTLLEPTPIELLRNKMVLSTLGIRVMGGLTGNVSIPRQTGAATAYSLSEIAQAAVSNQTIDQISLTPKRVSAVGIYSKQLLIQSAIAIENFMRDDLMTVNAIKLDYLGFNGSGAASEPQGIINTPGVGSVTFGAAATYAKLVAFETAINAANSQGGNRAYVTTPTAKGTLKSAAKFLTGGGTNVTNIALWEDNEINGYPALDTNQILNNQMIFGNFNSLIMAMFGGLDIVVDPYTLADKGEVKITINNFIDIALRHPQEFVVSADAANQ